MTFGVLFSNADNFAQMEMWRGINEFAREQDIHLIAYMGTYQSSHEDFASHLDTCFKTIYESKFLDGVILFSGFITHLIGGDEVYNKYVARIPKHIPCVSLSHIVPGVPSILADNIGGIHGAVDHLIKVHNKKQIVFIKGPDGHQEAEERLVGYKKALADNGIAFDDNYILPGDFSHEGARRAATALLDFRKIPFDAVAASDDITAIQVLTEFKRRGIQVPKDVAVTGFDDDRDAATFIPSVSTTRQDFRAMGLESAQKLFKLINGEEVNPVTYVPSVFITRQSCGCFKRNFSADVLDTDDAGATSLTPYVLKKVMPLFPQEISKRRAQGWVANLTRLITERPFRKNEFLTMLDEMLVGYSHRSKQYAVWHEVLDALMLGTQRFFREVENMNLVLETLLRATALVNDISTNEDKARENLQNDVRLALRRVTSALVLIFDINTLASELCRLLPEIDIEMALVGLYGTPIKSGDRTASRNIETLLGFDGAQRYNVKLHHNEAGVFSDFSSIENFDFFRERRALFFIPLFFRNEELGVIILPYIPTVTIHAYETLRVNISTAIKGAELLTKIQTLSITDELTGLLNRRGFFQFVYSRMEHIRRNAELIPTVMFMDMDGLKMINDTYGHKEGDRAIAAFAKILQDTLRKEDIVGRMGGDEFVVFSSVRQRETGAQVTQRIRNRIEEYNAQNLHPYKVACSIGSVVLEEATKECFETAILSADAVLYEEKMEKKKRGISRPLGV
ncbi:MAG: GGDEF domain-containing protein [Defluviitaleaceae bacterium]|nr:GGDEF domain-containing protein [Defluviitaleaceae bacterium]MCL2274396.1 GGDEF domain-containing protein [Defluviitaleaceae bacterium]